MKELELELAFEGVGQALLDLKREGVVVVFVALLVVGLSGEGVVDACFPLHRGCLAHGRCVH